MQDNICNLYLNLTEMTLRLRDNKFSTDNFIRQNVSLKMIRPSQIDISMRRILSDRQTSLHLVGLSARKNLASCIYS